MGFMLPIIRILLIICHSNAPFKIQHPTAFDPRTIHPRASFAMAALAFIPLLAEKLAQVLFLAKQ